MNYTIRKINYLDHENFLNLLNDFRNTSFTNEEFVSVLDNISHCSDIWVIELDDILVSTATILYENKFIHNISKVAHIEDVCTKKEYRGKGLGKILINHLINEAIKNSCYKVSLVCAQDVKNFYSSCGFEDKGIHMVYNV